ncbi:MULTISPECIES: winged helix-turn-helix domain-containing protein [Methylosinus]|uniref:Helix-turn-helix domain-containing protein n=1 Tax=Methylosinus trichosporium (strain ATCC 35070 / NCIMB 11131 / UNIQEM 75 / OB3b) TaxID=595536 RepID=A0A2D2CXF4_METT3|nr:MULTISPECIES: winged helix-turn-helix domain-containing protein [Methylosinus]ATQ67366.1 hypothetical protein CQW49_05255 [Methylosinus trichosporium OB3b]OBS51621.1 hypothetical protein A8B73_15535 [Methylosinus sp. 3S-1]
MQFHRWFKAQGADFLDMRLRKLPAGLFKHLYFLRCLAACNGGALPPVAEIAFLLGSSTAAVERRLAALREAGLIAEAGGELRIAGDEGAAEAPEVLSGAERTRRWRDRRGASGDGPRDEAVTLGDGIEKDQEGETDSPRVPRGAAVYERFDEFFETFPARDEESPREPALAAWRRAVVDDGADQAQLIRAAKAYAAAIASRERRFICSPARWLSEARWRASGPPQAAEAAPEPAGVWIEVGKPGWEEWSAWWRATKRRSPPIDKLGGWRFPSALPPEAPQLAA